MHFLIINSNTKESKELKELLKSLNTSAKEIPIQVIGSLSGAREYLKNNKTNAFVFCEFLLPDGAGIDLLKEIKTAKYKTINFIFASSNNDVNLIVSSINVGADGNIYYPWKAAEIQDLLNSLTVEEKFQITSPSIKIDTLNTVESKPEEKGSEEKEEEDTKSFDLSTLENFTSQDVEQWQNWLKNNQEKVMLKNTPVSLVEKFNSVPELLTANCQVESFYAPFWDKVKKTEVKKLIKRDVHFKTNLPLPNLLETLNTDGMQPQFLPSIYCSFLLECDLSRYQVYNRLPVAVYVINEMKKIVYGNQLAVSMAQISQKRIALKDCYLFDHFIWRPDVFFLNDRRPLQGDVSTKIAEMEYMLNEKDLGLAKVSIIKDDFAGANRKHWIIYILETTLESNLSKKYIGVKSQAQEFFQLSMTDQLTKFKLKSVFYADLEKEISRSGRYEFSFGLIAIDLDHFKKVNDTHGHLQGDAVLKGVAETINKHIRTSDIVYRYGGEEFFVLLPQTDEEGTKNVMEKLRGAIQKCQIPMVADKSKMMTVTASFGGCLVDFKVLGRAAVVDTMKIIDLADKNLYKSKEKGRNTWTMSTFKIES